MKLSGGLTNGPIGFDRPGSLAESTGFDPSAEVVEKWNYVIDGSVAFIYPGCAGGSQVACIPENHRWKQCLSLVARTRFLLAAGGCQTSLARSSPSQAEGRYPGWDTSLLATRFSNAL